MSQEANSLPLVDLKRQYETIKPDIQQAINEVLDHTDFIMGRAVDYFETAFGQFCGADFAIGVASGTAAIHLALYALGVGPGDEVITVPHTFIATVEPIVALGAKPVFVDVDPEDFTLDPRKLQAAITPRTKAIIPVHLYGQCADMSPILELAAPHHIPVIEDAAQAHGAGYHGQKAGTIGAAGCFSFYPGKNLGAYGDAGAITTNNPDLAARLRRLRNHGRAEKYAHLESGYGERLDTLQAAVLKVKLAHLAEWNMQRRQCADYYTELLGQTPDVQLPHVRPGSEHVFHLYVIRCAQRDALMAHLKARGIQTGIHYPLPLHLQPAYQNLGYRKGDFPVTECLAETILSLPLFPELTFAEVQRVATEIQAFFRQ